MFGKLARFLRMLGYDTLYRKAESVEEMLSESKQNNRLVVSGSGKIISICNKQQIESIYISSNDISEQLKEIKEGLQIIINFPPKEMRCSLCNGHLSSKNKSDIIDRIPEGTSKRYEEFWECDSCSQIFWLGSHWEDIKRIIQKLR
jgi:uncharacterized protein with PIN domain